MKTSPIKATANKQELTSWENTLITKNKDRIINFEISPADQLLQEFQTNTSRSWVDNEDDIEAGDCYKCVADELLGDPMHNLPVLVGGGGPATGFHHPRAASGKLTPMQIRCKYGQLGPSKGQFNSPHGFCLGTEEDIIVADTNNHRIQVTTLSSCVILCTNFVDRKVSKYG